MELTSNPDILRVAEYGTKFFVRGKEMEFCHLGDLSAIGKYNCVYLRAPKEVPDEDEYDQIHVRGVSGRNKRAAAFPVEELIELLKSGNFEIY